MKQIYKFMICSVMAAFVMVGQAFAQFNPEVKAGFFLITDMQATQDGFGSSSLVDDSYDWGYSASASRMRLSSSFKMTDRDLIVLSGEFSYVFGSGIPATSNIKLLDVRYDHKFADWLTLSVGRMTVSYNRNGYQGAGALAVNSFGYYQYTTTAVMQNIVARDVGVNFRGTIIEDRLRYRLGVFRGRQDFEAEGTAPPRVTGRLQYDMFDEDRYEGSNFGEGKTLTFAFGAETQSSYFTLSADSYLDMACGSAGSIVFCTAYGYMNAGSANSKYSFTPYMEDHMTYLAEFGYYFTKTKLQPWVRFEMLDRLNRSSADEFVYGAGLSYFPRGYRTNIKASYVVRENTLVGKRYGQAGLQLVVAM
ncbi:MAG: hypothetical protein SNH79_02890 [Rikenellaceae bacterium]